MTSEVGLFVDFFFDSFFLFFLNRFTLIIIARLPRLSPGNIGYRCFFILASLLPSCTRQEQDGCERSLYLGDSKRSRLGKRQRHKVVML